jgi:hypothetical protein
MRDITDASIVGYLMWKCDVRSDKILNIFVELSNVLKVIKDEGQDTRIFLGSITIYYRNGTFFIYV